MAFNFLYIFLIALAIESIRRKFFPLSKILKMPGSAQS